MVLDAASGVFDVIVMATAPRTGSDGRRIARLARRHHVVLAFADADEILHPEQLPPRAVPAPAALLADVGLCGVCGVALVVDLPPLGGPAVYRCGGMGNGCDLPPMAVHAVDGRVTDAVLALVSEVENFRFLEDRFSLAAQQVEELHAHAGRGTSAAAELDTAQRELEKVTALLSAVTAVRGRATGDAATRRGLVRELLTGRPVYVGRQDIEAGVVICAMAGGQRSASIALPVVV